MTVKKKILLINRQSPYQDITTIESLDIALTASAFAQDLSLLFLDDGVWQLKKQQDASQTKLKQFTVTFNALSLYDIDTIYIDKYSLETRGLDASDLLIPTIPLDTHALKQMLNQQDFIVSY